MPGRQMNKEIASTEHAVSGESSDRFWLRFLLFPTLAITAYPLFIMGFGGTGWFPQTLWVVFLTYCWFCVGGAFHEAAHQTLFRNSEWNLWYGRLLGWMIGIPYSVYRETHRRHHAYLNTPDDYELWPYSDPSTSLMFRRFFVWVDLLFGVFTAPLIYGRIYFNHDERLSAKVRLTILLEYVGGILFWGALVSGIVVILSQQGVTWESFQLTWLLPLVLSPVMNTVRKFVEHLGLQDPDPFLGTRTVVSKNSIERMLSFFNFDIAIHGPHHRFPRAHHHQLEQKLREYQASHPDQNVPLFGSYLSAARDVLKCIWHAPQTGTHKVDKVASQMSHSTESDSWDRLETVTQ